MEYKEFGLTEKYCKEHKKIYIFLNVITYFLFFPCAILQIIEDITGNILNIIIPLRGKIIKYFMYLIIKREEKTNENRR